jgi:DNA-binding Lrp family transcriptional regulator
MSLDLINQHVAKILLALEEGDSINRISQKTGSSYGWTHEWVERLEEAEIITRDDGLTIQDEEVAEQYKDLAQSVFSREVELEDAYLLPNFSGMDYRYSETDAVYIWTKGGYQVARNQNDYPIFIDVKKSELEAWQNFLEEFSVEYTVEERRKDEEGIYFVLNPRPGFDSEWFENTSVTPLDETVEWAKQYMYNFEPALEMLDEMYDLDLGVEYSEK